MPLADFVHLRVHTAYSLSAGAIRVKKLVERCRAEQMPAVAITDTGNLFGALEFATSCAEAGIQPIIGCELALAGGATIRVNGAGGRPAEPDRIVLLVQSEAGYRNLLALVSQSYLSGEGGVEPAVAISDLAASGDGLICLAGGAKGPVGRLLAEGQGDAAEAVLGELSAAFPGRLYIELTRHGEPQEERSEPGLVDLAYRHGLPLVATNDAYFPDRDFYDAHDALLCIAQSTVVADTDRKRLTPSHYFRPAGEMREVFADLPEACDNTLVIARRCAFIPQPRQPILPTFPTTAGESEEADLRRAASAGLATRLAAQGVGEGEARPYRERLEFELATIIQMGFAGYFLIVADFIQWAKRAGIPVGPGRGSGAGSVVAWALTITDLDPLRFGLLFERFLNPERVSMPDFDIDFCQDRRDEVIRYVQQKYGRDRVAQIITFGTLQARAVLRDVGRVLAMPYGQVDRLCKLVPNNPAHPVSLERAIAGEPALQQQRDGDERVARLIEIALKLEGLYRHASTHAAGVVIGDRPLAELVPLYRDPRSDMPVTQFNMKWVERAGLVKFDFLGLKTLTVVARCQELLEARGVVLDFANLPLDDRPTYELLARGDTIGVFQVEGQGTRDMLRKLRPDRFEDIVAAIALYRPGPMESIPRYTAVKHGEEMPDYLHPTLEPILKETYGVMTYQEQVMQIAQRLAGYSLGGADVLRHAMGKKIQSEMDAQRKTFVEGAMARGIERRLAELIFDQMAKFAGYGFNKPHAAAYALITYQTAYLKANHPVEFMAASMTLELGNTDKLAHFRQELNRLGIRLLPPDINRSQPGFSVETDAATGRPAIRYALAAVKGVGEEAMRVLVQERERNGPFRNPGDFARRLDPKSFNRRQYESLAKAGAFDPLELQPGADNCRRRNAAAPGEPRRRGAREPAGKPVRRHRPEFCAAPVIAAGRRLAGRRKIAARIRRDRVLFVEPSARRLWQKPQSGRDRALGRSGVGAVGQRQQPVQARGDRRQPQGAHLGARQPVRFCPDVRPERGFRGDAVRRNIARSAGVARYRPTAGRHRRCIERRRQPAPDRAKIRAARRSGQPCCGGPQGFCRRDRSLEPPEGRDRARACRAWPRCDRARPAGNGGRDRDPGHLPCRSAIPRRA